MFRRLFVKAEAKVESRDILVSKQEPVILETVVTKLVPPKEETRPSRVVIRDNLKKEDHVCR